MRVQCLQFDSGREVVRQYYRYEQFITIYFPSIGVSELGAKRFQAKISLDNGPSLGLFQKKLGFIEVRTPLSTYTNQCG